MSRASGERASAPNAFANRTGTLGGASVAADACEIPDSRALSIGSLAASGSHRKTATIENAKERKSERVFNGLINQRWGLKAALRAM
jgi:hypothetical protein